MRELPCWTENGVYVAISEKGKRQYTLIAPPGWKARLIARIAKFLLIPRS